MLHSVEGNAFTTDRDLLGYQRVLGTGLVSFLHGLHRDQQWIDAGAGQALAARQYLLSDEFPEKARVTAVAIRRPESQALADLERRFPPPAFRHLAGSPLEERPLEELGPCVLITDVYGAIQYAARLDRLVERYAELLEPGGRLWTVLPAATFVSDGGATLGLGDWLGSVEGLAAIRIPTEDDHAREVILERNRDAIRVPPLELKRMLDGPPPMREYGLGASGADPPSSATSRGATRSEARLEPLLGLLRDAPDDGDLHRVAGAPPCIRGPRGARSLEESALTAQEVRAAISTALGPEARTRLEERGEAVAVFDSGATGRFRADAGRVDPELFLALRALPTSLPTPEELEIPRPILKFMSRPRLESGLVLVTGPRRSGRTTTVAALLQAGCRARALRVLTLEEAVEHRLDPGPGTVAQCEVGPDRRDVDVAASAARVGADVVFVGELRHPADLESALDTVDDGRLVMATLEATSLESAMTRLVRNRGENGRRDLIARLAHALRFFLCQRLVPLKQGRGLALAADCLPVSLRATDHLEKGEWEEAYRAVRLSGSDHQPLDGYLAYLVSRDRVELAEAASVCHRPEELLDILNRVRNPPTSDGPAADSPGARPLETASSSRAVGWPRPAGSSAPPAQARGEEDGGVRRR